MGDLILKKPKEIRAFLTNTLLVKAIIAWAESNPGEAETVSRYRQECEAARPTLCHVQPRCVRLPSLSVRRVAPPPAALRPGHAVRGRRHGHRHHRRAAVSLVRAATAGQPGIRASGHPDIRTSGRRGRKGFAEDAERTAKKLCFSFCVLCEISALSAPGCWAF